MDSSLSGKTVVITGATSGIGQVAAESLARLGARIVQIARDRNRGAQALQRLRNLAPNADHAIHYADLSLLRETNRVAEEIDKSQPRVEVLINNAGAMFSKRQVTDDGLEFTFALNHMSYFVLTNRLLPKLIASAPSRIVNTASDAHKPFALDLDDLQSVRAYADSGIGAWLRYGGPGFAVYGRSKLCNILFTRELARRLRGAGVTVNSLHPGFVATRFGDQSGGAVSFGIGFLKRFALTPEQGALTITYLASSPEGAAVSGEYFHECMPKQPSARAQDDEIANQLWAESVRLAGAR